MRTLPEILKDLLCKKSKPPTPQCNGFFIPTGIELYREICDKSKIMFNSVALNQPDQQMGNAFHAAVRELEAIEKMLAKQRHYSLAFTGLTNVGKSTLLNALLGDAVAPTKNCPWSSTAVEYSFSTSPQYEIAVPLEGIKSLHKCFATPQQLLNALNQFAVENGSFQTDRSLVVKLPNPFLEGDMTIVDTPGFGAADGSNQEGLHDQILLEYLRRKHEDLKVFWIVKDNIDQIAVRFFHDHLEDICSDLIVNVTSDLDEDFKEQFEKLYRPEVGYTVTFHFVNAKKAVKGIKKEDDELIQESNIVPLKEYLNAFSSREKRTLIVEERLQNLFFCMHFFLHETNNFACKFKKTEKTLVESLIRGSGKEKLLDSFLQMCQMN